MLAVAGFIAYKTVPGIIIKKQFEAAVYAELEDPSCLYTLSKPFPLSDDVFNSENGVEISNDFFSVMVPNEVTLKDERDSYYLYTSPNAENSDKPKYVISLDKKALGYSLTDAVGIDEQLDKLFMKYTGRPYIRGIKDAEELIFSYTPDDFNVWDRKQCVVISTILTMKSNIATSVSEFYTYEKDGITAHVDVYNSGTGKYVYTITVFDTQAQKSCRCMFIMTDIEGNHELAMKMLNSVTAKQH